MQILLALVSIAMLVHTTPAKYPAPTSNGKKPTSKATTRN
jgi:hypothetical protein